MSNPATSQELWAGYTAISPHEQQVGQYKWGGFAFQLRLKNEEENWLMVDLPTPNVREGWRIKSVMLRWRTRESGYAGIDKVGIKDADVVIHEFNQLSLRSFNNWSTIPLALPGQPRRFKFGLGISIHIKNKLDSKADPPFAPPSLIEIASIGAEFVK